MSIKISTIFDNYINYSTISGMSSDHISLTKRARDMLVETVGDKKFKNLTSEDIHALYKKLCVGRSDNTVRNYICVVRSTLDFARRSGLEGLSCDLVPIPKRRSNVPSYLTSEEVSLLISGACDDRGRFIISFLYSSGVRISEFLSLKRNCIHNGSFSVIGKNGKHRVCFVDNRTIELMDKYYATRVDGCDNIVTTRYGRVPSRQTVEQVISLASRRVGLDKKRVTPHTLRHSFATNLMINNCNIRYISDMLGHSSLNTTAIYTHICDNDLRNKYLTYHSV